MQSFPLIRCHSVFFIFCLLYKQKSGFAAFPHFLSLISYFLFFFFFRKAENKKSEVGNFLLSQEAALQVPSADTRLTAGFGMFPGIPTLLWSPTSLFLFTFYNMYSCRLQFPEDLPVPYTTQKPSIISTGLLNTLLYFHLRPIQQVVSLRSYTFRSRELISKQVSHLDAFSGYLFRTWLLSDAPGGTTDTPEVRPPRSSRTRGSPSQFSFAHSG